MSAALDGLPEEILRLLADRASRGASAGLTRQGIAGTLGYSSSSVSIALKSLVESDRLRTHRDHSPGSKYRVLHYRPTARGLQQGVQDPPLSAFSLPEPAEPFVDRSRELAQLRRAYLSGGIVLIDGVAGMGKTALVRRSLRHTWNSYRTLWTTLPPDLGPEEMLDLLRSGRSVPLQGAKRPPRSSRASRPLLWVVDDLDRASPETQQAVSDVLHSPESFGLQTAVLITSLGVHFPVPGRPALHLTLGGLPRREALLLTRAAGLPDDRFEETWGATLGSPRYLRLSATTGGPSHGRFGQAVVASFSEALRTSLIPVALSWHGLPFALVRELGCDEPTLLRLQSQAVLEGPAAGLRLVEPVAQALVAAAPFEEVRDAHRKLAYLPGSIAAPERFVHLVLAERHGEAFQLLKEQEGEVLRRGQRRVLEAALRLAPHLSPGPERGVLWLAVAELHRSWGDTVQAARFLASALENLPRYDPRAVTVAGRLVQSALRSGSVSNARAWASWLHAHRQNPLWTPVNLLTKGVIAAGEGDWTRAASCFAEAERRARGQRQPEIQLLAAHGLLESQWRRGQLVGAQETFARLLPLARKVASPDTLRRVLLTGGLLETLTENFEGARRTYAGLLVESRTAGARSIQAIALLGLAHLDGREGRTQLAIRQTREAVALAESVLDWMTASRGYAALAELQRREGNLVEAESLVERSRKLAKETVPRMNLPFTNEAAALLREELHGRRSRRATEAESARLPVAARESGAGSA